MGPFASNLASARGLVASAAARAGRNPAEVSVLCATKHASAEQITQLASLEPHLIIGENRVQDAEEKFAELRHLLPPASFAAIEKHFIGTLQSNKVRDAVRLFDCIQSVDSLRLAQKIDSCARKEGKTMPIYIEVNNGEPRKGGVPFPALGTLISSLRTLPNLSLAGLMGMGLEGNGQATREFFRKLYRAAVSHDLKTSMGMSDDFEIAVEEGSDMVRLGRAIFSAD